MITFEQVREIISRELGVEPKEIQPTTAFAIPEDDAQRIIVVQDVVTFAGAN